jgi:rsbT co-antagonist protein RsbR
MTRTLRPIALTSMPRAIEELRRFIPDCADRAADRVYTGATPSYPALVPRDIVREGMLRSLGVMLADIERGEIVAFPAALERLAADRVARGVAVTELLVATNIVFDVISEHFRDAFAGDLEAQLWWERQRSALNHLGLTAFVSSYMAAREAFIRQQALAIQALSAPIIPIYKGILLLPLIGVVDAERAEQIMASLLESIGRHAAQTVILDVTGVPVVDGRVAEYLRRAAQATRLMGAEIIVVGINPQMAKTVVELGIDLRAIPVLADLQGGVEYALRLAGMAIISKR